MPGSHPGACLCRVFASQSVASECSAKVMGWAGHAGGSQASGAPPTSRTISPSAHLTCHFHRWHSESVVLRVRLREGNVSESNVGSGAADEKVNEPAD